MKFTANLITLLNLQKILRKQGRILDFYGLVLEHCFQCDWKNNGGSGQWIFVRILLRLNLDLMHSLIGIRTSLEKKQLKEKTETGLNKNLSH